VFLRALPTRRTLLAFAAAMALPFPARAQAERATRAALVIGNGAYPNATLRHPRSDADAMAKLLARLKFRVFLAHNLTIRRMHVAISDFAASLRPGDLVVLYYSGQAMQLDKRNYLIPVNAEVLSPRAVKLETVDLINTVEQFAPAERKGVIALVDACRINPYQRRIGVLGTGLAPLAATPGTLYAFSAQPDFGSFDGDGPNTPYAGALLDVLPQPGLTIAAALERVRAKVYADTVEQQTPWFTSALIEPVVLAPE
jgi:uncharacterized caspase-like protein